MKKTILNLTLAAMIGGISLTACESKEKKVEDAQTKVDDAKQDLKDAKNDKQRELNAEYPAYKTAAEEKINANQKMIDDLRAKLAKPGERPLDDNRRKRIADLEERNSALRAKLNGYEKERGDWESFKKEFNHDMDEVGNSFKDASKDNVK